MSDVLSSGWLPPSANTLSPLQNDGPGSQADGANGTARPGGPPARLRISAQELAILRVLPDPVQLQRLALALRNGPSPLPRQIAQLKAKLFAGSTPPQDNEGILSRAVELGIVDPSAPGWHGRSRSARRKWSCPC